MVRTLYGADGVSGVVGCVKKFITRGQAWAGIVCIGVPLVVGVWALYVKTDDRLRELEKALAVYVGASTASIAKVSDKVVDLQCSVGELRTEMKATATAVTDIKLQINRLHAGNSGAVAPNDKRSPITK